MQIHEAPHGINVVVETAEPRLYIGRFDQTNGFTALLHDCDVRDITPGEDIEPYVRETAKYGVDVKKKDVQVHVAQIRRVRLLRDIPKPD